MTGAPRLRPEDRADVDRMLRLAPGPGGPGAAADAEEIAAAAGDEYRAYLKARQQAGDSRPVRDALAVLAPLVSATAAAVVLLTGYTLRLAGTAARPASTMVTAGWLLALVAAVSAVIGLWAVLPAALDRRARTPEDAEATVAAARERWRRAVLERGVRPRPDGHPALPGPLTSAATSAEEATGAGRSE